MQMWEIRLVDGSSILVEVDGKRNLAHEFEVLSNRWWRWFRLFQPTATIRVLVRTVSVVQPFAPKELKKKINKYNPPPRDRRTEVKGFAG